MLKLRSDQMERATGALRDAVTYADEIIRDERLRADILAAIGHGSEAGDRIRKDIDDAGIAKRLAADEKLRKKLRQTLDDLDNVGERLRRKQRHRIRNVALIIAGAGAVAAIAPSARRWLTHAGAESTSAIPVT
jgi:hypothetical protein